MGHYFNTSSKLSYSVFTKCRTVVGIRIFHLENNLNINRKLILSTQNQSKLQKLGTRLLFVPAKKCDGSVT